MRHVVLGHFERSLGKGTCVSAPGGEIAVFSFPMGPIRGLCSYATVGLSERTLLLRRSWRPVRMELIMGGEAESADVVAAAMTRVAERLWSSGHAFLRGDLMSLETPLFPGTVVKSVFAAPPVHFPKDVHTTKELDPPLVVVELVPLVGREDDYVWTHGWKSFEEKLDDADDVNLWDVRRKPLVDHG